MRPIVFAIALITAGTAAFAACGGGDDKTIDIGDGEINVSDDLPDDFPDDFPQYDDAVVMGSVTGESSGQEGTLVTFQTDDSLEDVEAFYEAEFEDGPWQQVSNSSSSQGGSFLVEKDDVAASVFFAEVDGKTSILVTYGNKDDFGIDGSDDGDSSDDDGSSRNGDEPTADDADDGSSSDDGSSDDEGSSDDDDGSSDTTDLPDEVDLEDDFPSNIPLPDGARVTSSSSLASGGFSTVFAELYVQDSIDDLKTYFEDTLAEAGYTESISSSAGGQIFLSYTEGDGSSGNGVLVNISESAVDGYALVTVTVTGAGE